MINDKYTIPSQIVDLKEKKILDDFTKAYEKMTEPSLTGIAVSKIGEKIPDNFKDIVKATKTTITDNDVFTKSMEILAKGFDVLEQYASKVTLTENDVIKQISSIEDTNKITCLDEICLVRGYEISKIVNKNKFVDIIATIIEGAATGAPGFVGIPFNLVLSTFLFYRAVQSIALFYGYDIKNDPIELEISSEVFMSALNPKKSIGTELSGTISKIMLISTATSVKQVAKKGWTAMADKGGVHLLLTQMRALANNAAKKAIEKAGKASLEKTAFSEVFEQIGKHLTQKTIGKVIPYVGAFIGAVIDTSQMIKIINFANIFYCKRFIVEKEERINLLLDSNVQKDNSNIIVEVEEYTEV